MKLTMTTTMETVTPRSALILNCVLMIRNQCPKYISVTSVVSLFCSYLVIANIIRQGFNKVGTVFYVVSVYIVAVQQPAKSS